MKASAAEVQKMMEEARRHMMRHGTGVWSDDQLLASYALAWLRGGYHHLGKIKECGPSGVETSIHGTLATFDSEGLTKAVLIAHAMGVRLEVGSSGPRMLKIYAHVRVLSDEGHLRMFERHPTLLGLMKKVETFADWEGDA